MTNVRANSWNGTSIQVFWNKVDPNDPGLKGTIRGYRVSSRTQLFRLLWPRDWFCIIINTSKFYIFITWYSRFFTTSIATTTAST